jgi:hypothetical protein
MSSRQALIRNRRNPRWNAKGKSTIILRLKVPINIQQGLGSTHSSDEVLVMSME